MTIRHPMWWAPALISALSTVALADDAPATPVCSNETLQGSYAVSVSGTAPAASVLPQYFQPPGTLEQIIVVVVQTFDGKGNFTQVDTVKGSLSGVVLDRPGRGTYSVNANCSGTYSILRPEPLPPLVVRFVLSDGGKQFRAIVISPQPNMTVASGRKM